MRRYTYSARLAFLFLSFPLTSLASSERTDALIGKHLDALGGSRAVRTIGSLVSTAEIEILGTGLKGTVESRSLRPCLSYSEVSLGFFKVREGYDGERIWMVDPNGKLQLRRDAASLEYQKTMCLLESQAYLFGGDGFELEAIGKDTVGSNPSEGLRLAVDGGTSARLFHNIFSLPASLDGVKGAFYLDTGANSSLLHGSFVDTAGLARGRRTLPIAIRGAGGEEKASLCRFDSLRIGGITVERPVLAITRGEKGISALENVDGIIGNDILERFTMTLDYRKQRVLRKKNARFGEPFHRDRSGLELARKEDGRIVVVKVLAGSPGAKAGLRPTRSRSREAAKRRSCP